VACVRHQRRRARPGGALTENAVVRPYPAEATDPAEVEDWLGERLRAMHGDDPLLRVAAADFTRYGILHADSELDALHLFFRSLPLAGMRVFQRAVAALLRHAQPVDFPPEAMKDLVLLSGLTQTHEALGTFEPIIGSGAWGEYIPDLTYCALAVLKGLKHANEAYDGTRALIGTRNFAPAYLFDAYEILVANRPERWDEDFLDIAPALAQHAEHVLRSDDFAALKQFWRRYEMLAEDLTIYVSLAHLARGLAVLTRHTAELSEVRPIGRLVMLLAQPLEHAEVIMDEADGEFSLVQRKTGMRQGLPPLGPAGDLYLDTQWRRFHPIKAAGAPLRPEVAHLHRRSSDLLSDVMAPRDAIDDELDASI